MRVTLRGRSDAMCARAMKRSCYIALLHLYTFAEEEPTEPSAATRTTVPLCSQVLSHTSTLDCRARLRLTSRSSTRQRAPAIRPALRTAASDCSVNSGSITSTHQSKHE